MIFGDAGLLDRADPPDPLPLDEVAFGRLLIAAGLGILIAALARIGRGKARDERDLTPTLVLLPTLVALVSLVINGDLARAFSLVGALAVVRFRTVVDDTRDTAFVIYAVGAGMAAGTGLWRYALMAAPIVGVLAYLTRKRGPGGTFEVRVRLASGSQPDELLGPTLAKHLAVRHLVSVEAAKQGAALDATYRGEMADASSLSELAGELARLPGVQEADVRRCKG